MKSLLSLLAALMMSSCTRDSGSGASHPAPEEDWPTHTVPGPAGVTVRAPPDVELCSSGSATLCLSQGEMMRSPWRIRLTQAALPALPEAEAVPLRGGLIAQAGPLRTLGGGSGGTEYERDGWLSLGAGGPVLTFQLQDQAESPGGPNEAMLWTVLSTAEVGTMPVSHTAE